jgi:hypothetical protein
MHGKKAKAHHEAGHAVIARVLGVEVTYAAMLDANVQTTGALYAARNGEPAALIAGAEKDAKVALAGAIAQQHYRPVTKGQMLKAAREGGWTDDMATAKSLTAHILYFQNGRSASDLHNEPDPQGALKPLTETSEASALFNRLWNETQILVECHWQAVERVAAAMLERRVLNQDDIDGIIRACVD